MWKACLLHLLRDPLAVTQKTKILCIAPIPFFPSLLGLYKYPVFILGKKIRCWFIDHLKNACHLSPVLSEMFAFFWRQIRFSTHECLDASKQIVEMETVIYLSGYVSTCSKKRKMQKRYQCIVGALPSTHFNAHPLCLGIHVQNCLRDSRGSLEAGCGSWNWINFQSSPHMVTASPLRDGGGWGRGRSGHLMDHSQGSKDHTPFCLLHGSTFYPVCSVNISVHPWLNWNYALDVNSDNPCLNCLPHSHPCLLSQFHGLLLGSESFPTPLNALSCLNPTAPSASLSGTNIMKYPDENIYV